MLIAIASVQRALKQDGWIQILPLTGRPERFSTLESVLLEQKGIWKKFIVLDCKISDSSIALLLEGITSRTAAEELKKAVIYIPEEQRISTGKDEYFVDDLPGLKVFIKNQQCGELSRFFGEEYGNPMLEIKTESSSFLIPFCKEYISEINISAGKIILLESALDLIRLNDENYDNQHLS